MMKPFALTLTLPLLVLSGCLHEVGGEDQVTAPGLGDDGALSTGSGTYDYNHRMTMCKGSQNDKVIAQPWTATVVKVNEHRLRIDTIKAPRDNYIATAILVFETPDARPAGATGIFVNQSTGASSGPTTDRDFVVIRAADSATQDGSSTVLDRLPSRFQGIPLTVSLVTADMCGHWVASPLPGTITLSGSTPTEANGPTIAFATRCGSIRVSDDTAVDTISADVVNSAGTHLNTVLYTQEQTLFGAFNGLYPTDTTVAFDDPGQPMMTGTNRLFSAVAAPYAGVNLVHEVLHATFTAIDVFGNTTTVSTDCQF